MNVLLCGGIRDHHDYLYQAGYQVTWLLNRSSLTPEDWNSSARRFIVYAPEDSYTLLAEQVRQLHQQLDFQRVFAFHDDSQQLAAHLAHAIGRDFPISHAAVHNTRNKVAARLALDGAGVPSCWYAEATDKQALFGILRQCELAKVIIKPSDGTGSIGVVALEEPANVDEGWLDEHVTCYPVLVEEFLCGKEFSVESFSVSGRHYVLGITEKFIDAASFIEIGHVFPAELDSLITEEITSYVAKVLAATGIEHTVAHTEIMLTAQGPRLIETHTRVGGDYIPQLVRQVTGVDLYEIGARLQEGHWSSYFVEQYTVPASDGWCGIRYLLPDAPGRIVKSVHGVEQARAFPGVVQAHALRKPGERIKSLIESFPRTAYVIAKSPSRTELCDILTAAIGSIHYEYE
ncbi:ATP-grasp domain-containing protein [Pseudomonas cucumis]|uniref:ATP-grasp domain-containing protein n=1 Tax=Pseudomonas cucumis TaxID=2954082 RepID=A0ABY9F0S5_9PSED|nr:ATP-grasp domain-containing protein [Pseudomonas cucumis]WLG85677.1 ATP-grasp domain-containing protein [Pseudomonas cucumis]